MGWTNLNRFSRMLNYRALRGTSPDGKPNQIAPNPLFDLNIIHVAEKSLTLDQDMKYNKLISNIGWCGYPRCWSWWRLEPKQKLECFLKAIDKYEED